MIDYLSDKELKEVQKFYSNDVMREAVKKVMLSGIYFDGILKPDAPADPQKNFILGAMTTQHAQTLSQAERGAKLDGIINAISLVESAFKEIEKLKTNEPHTVETKNRAR